MMLVTEKPGGARLGGTRCPLPCESPGEAAPLPTAWHLMVLGKLLMLPPAKGGRSQTQERASGMGRNGTRGFGGQQEGGAPPAQRGGTPGQRLENGKGRKYLDEGLSNASLSAHLSSPTSHH